MPETLAQPAKLLGKLHGKGSRHIELTDETLTIGRKADNTLVIEDPAVSGHHARIVKVQAVFFLEGLKSTNGTAINGRPITRHQLRDADVITIGQHRLVFQENAAASTAACPICRSGSNHGAQRNGPHNRRTDAHGQSPDCCRENRSVGIPTHQTGECHWVTRRIGHSSDRLGLPQNRRRRSPDEARATPSALLRARSLCASTARMLWDNRT